MVMHSIEGGGGGGGVGGGGGQYQARTNIFLSNISTIIEKMVPVAI